MAAPKGKGHSVYFRVESAMYQMGAIAVRGSKGGTVEFWDGSSRELLDLLNNAHWSAIDALALVPTGKTVLQAVTRDI